MDQIDIDGGGADQIGDGEEVVGSGGIRVEKAGDPDSSDNDLLLNHGADRIRVVGEGGTDRNDIDDADVDLDGNEGELQIGGGPGEHYHRDVDPTGGGSDGASRVGETLARVRFVG
jgi:hypothetical protein